MPLFHIGGCGWSLVMLHAGLSVVLLCDPDPPLLARAVQRFRVTQMFVVPVLLSAMVNHPQRADFDLRSLAASVLRRKSDQLQRFWRLRLGTYRAVLCGFMD